MTLKNIVENKKILCMGRKLSYSNVNEYRFFGLTKNVNVNFKLFHKNFVTKFRSCLSLKNLDTLHITSESYSLGKIESVLIYFRNMCGGFCSD
jgi:hypothetical protein